MYCMYICALHIKTEADRTDIFAPRELIFHPLRVINCREYIVRTYSRITGL